mmetsp:Transcript_34575/g.59408  ORF Transcript_34575/g.59408 Transcript_34575/m.59408 type:complete len:177 (-) Transcript_34575:79-609(-)
MTFIGRAGWPAPQLHDVAKSQLTRSAWHRTYLQTLGVVRDLWHRASLVHADLSEYNLLYFDKRVYVIDLGQAVDTGHQDVLKFLRIDLRNVLKFFASRQVAVHDLEVALTFVTERDAVGGMRDGDHTHEMAAANLLTSMPGSEGEVQGALDAIVRGEAAVDDALGDAIRAMQSAKA